MNGRSYRLRWHSVPLTILSPTHMWKGKTIPSRRPSPPSVMLLVGRRAGMNVSPHTEFAYNTSVNQSLGETPFFQNNGRTHKVPNPAVEDFTQLETLQNQILEPELGIISAGPRRLGLSASRA